MAQTSSGESQVGAIVVGLRPGDHKDLDQIAQLIGRPAKEVAGILLEQAIRRESGYRLTPVNHPNVSHEPEAIAR